MGQAYPHYFPVPARLNKPLTWFILAILPGCVPMAMVGSEPPTPPREISSVAAPAPPPAPPAVSMPPELIPVPAVLPVADHLFSKTSQPLSSGPLFPNLAPAEAIVIPNSRHNQTSPVDLHALIQQMESRNFENLPSEDAKTAALRLRKIAHRLEQGQPLAVRRVTLARSVDANGTCHPWPAGHLFRPGRGDEPGDRMLVYLEIDHLKHVAREGRDECQFTVRLELRDRSTIKQSMNFPAKVMRQRADFDSHWLTLCFHLPGKLNPGPHSLVVVVEQQEMPARLVARKSIDFVVGLGPDSDQTAPAGEPGS